MDCVGRTDLVNFFNLAARLVAAMGGLSSGPDDFCLPANQGMLTGAALYMVTLAEWPVLWSGDFTMPWAAAIILRTLLLALCAYQFDRVIHQEVLPQA